MNDINRYLKLVELKKAINMINEKDYEEIAKFLRRIRSNYPNYNPSLNFYQYKDQPGLIAIFNIEGIDVGKIQLVADREA